jgi:hypothetical protein
MVFVAFIVVERITSLQPAGFRMLAIIGAVLFSMKVIVSVEAQKSGCERLKPRNWFVFTLAWPDMRPVLFAEISGKPLDGWEKTIRQGLQFIVLGVACLTVARYWEQNSTSFFGETGQLLLVTGFLLTGLSLILHFGLFNLLAGLWRLAGVNCRALFRAPLLSRSLSEFWSRRWNLAFSEMTAIAVFRPLNRLIGKRAAGMTAFLFSELLHELAISVPVKTGYGLPMAYFALHALALQIEIQLEQAGMPISTWSWCGRLWTALWVLVPLPILFHRPFLEGVVFPIIR